MDVEQNIFVAVARNIKTFRLERPEDSFRAWPFTITRNKSRDWRRTVVEVREGGSGPGRVGEILADPVPEPDDESVRDERRHLVYRTIELVRWEFEPNTWSVLANGGGRPVG